MVSNTPALSYHAVFAQNAPNPFKSRTEIRFSLPVSAELALYIYDVSGRKVKTLVREKRVAGVYSITWDGTDEKGKQVGAGVYFYVLKIGGKEILKRSCVLMKQAK